jgi:hypothetical protein
MKSYTEIANSVFERRDLYIKNKKRQKRIIISTITPTISCYVILVVSLALFNKDIFYNKTPIFNESQSSSHNTNHDSIFIGSHDSSTSSNNSSQNNNSESNSSNNSSSQNSSTNDESTPSNKPSEEASSSPSNDASNDTSSVPPVVETDYFLDSIGKINFYLAKKAIMENSYSHTPTSNVLGNPNPLLLSKINRYPIDRDKVFTTKMITYFTININSKYGFLAQNLGGNGLVEVVVIENDIENLGPMITFRKNNFYKTFLMESEYKEPNSNKVIRVFNTKRSIDRFDIYENLERENLIFTVRYNGLKVVGFECESDQKGEVWASNDDVTLIEDNCFVLYSEQTFTISELEAYFKNRAKGELI